MRCEQFYKFKKVRDFNNRKSTLFFLQKGLNYGLINYELRNLGEIRRKFPLFLQIKKSVEWKVCFWKAKLGKSPLMQKSLYERFVILP